MSDLVLYNYFRSSASYRVRIGLHLKGLSFEYKAVHLLNDGGEQNKTAYKDLNPAGEVPTLIHGSQRLSQSMAILQYLDEVFPQQPLFPKNSFEKAKVIQFCEGINCTQPYQNLRTLQFLEKEFSFQQSQKEKWLQHWIGRNLEASEKILESTAGKFCFGDQITAAEAFLIPQLFTAHRFGIDFKKYPLISKIQKTSEELEAFKKAHPFQQPDTPSDLKI
ncbi:MAG: maleylacetoacetate isomerase [Pseudobdellovibrionaceae bacterium]